MTLRLRMYLRKSSESEERQELSIPAQERELVALAQRLGLNVVGDPITEAMSAKVPGRPKFDALMNDIKLGRADGILCWHLDRLARNPVDGGAIMWGLGQGTIKQIVTPGRNYTGTADDKLMMSIIFGMATKYSDDLSQNVRRGNREALERGQWINRPKIGYRRDRESMRIVADPERFDVMRELWRLRLSGSSPLELARRARDEFGLRTPRYGKVGGKPLSPSQMYRVFSDAFYAGLMVVHGELYRGTHPPMISLDAFNALQERKGAVRVGGRSSRPKLYAYAYRGLISCGSCGAMVTAEKKTNRHGHHYLYYHCCRKHERWSKCPERSVERRDLDAQLTAFASTLAVPADVVDWGLRQAQTADGDAETANRKSRVAREADLRRIDERLAKLRALCAEGVITADELAKDRSRLSMERARVEGELTRDSARLLEPLESAFSLANSAKSVMLGDDAVQKHELARSLFSNLALKEKKLLIQAKKVYVIFQKTKTIPELWSHWEDVRKALASDPEAETKHGC